MATESDDFTTNRDAALWDEGKSNVNVSVTDDGTEVDITSTITANEHGFLARKVTRDMTAPASAEIKRTSGGGLGGWLVSSLTQTTSANPFSESNMYRVISVSTTWYAQKRVAGSLTTISSGAGGGNFVHKLDFPTTGDDVRFIVNAVERASIATYDFGSRDLYHHVGGTVDNSDSCSIDDYFCTYFTAGATTIPVIMHHRQNQGQS